jgi:hypothetical protein
MRAYGVDRLDRSTRAFAAEPFPRCRVTRVEAAAEFDGDVEFGAVRRLLLHRYREAGAARLGGGPNDAAPPARQQRQQAPEARMRIRLRDMVLSSTIRHRWRSPARQRQQAAAPPSNSLVLICRAFLARSAVTGCSLVICSRTDAGDALPVARRAGDMAAEPREGEAGHFHAAQSWRRSG